MKILYVVKNMRLANGVASYVMNYYRKLKNEPHVRMHFLIVTDVPSPYYDEIKSDGNNVYILPSYKKSFFKINKYLLELFKKEKYDIIHCNTINSSSLILKSAKKFGIPVRILHSHATQNGDNILKRFIGILFKSISIRNANVYFACSKYAGESIFKNLNFDVIPNAINISKFQFNRQVRNEIRKKENISDDKIVVMTVGRITTQKNPFFIVDIMKKIKNINKDIIFWWLGSGDLDNEIKQYITENKLQNRIKLFGTVSNVNEYYSAADIFILPSLFEGLPVVGIEAQISGMTTLFSDNITNEVKISKNCFFLSIKSVDLWVNEIFKIGKYNRNKNIDSIQSELYDINLQYKNLLNKYAELLERKKNDF